MPSSILVDTLDWSQLQHAYGPATDTPGHLDALESGDAEARTAALSHLWVAVLHQGFPETSTAPAVRAVTALLAEGRAHPDAAGGLLEFLELAARSTIDLAGNDYFAGLLPDLADAVTAAYPVALSLLESSPPERALYRAELLTAIARMPSLADRREELAILTELWTEAVQGAPAVANTRRSESNVASERRPSA
jgi:hypothetical protein